jgi:hypothetical protein
MFTDSVPILRCELTRWLADEPQPGLVEARMTDASGRTWLFVDKPPIFTNQVISPATAFPVAAGIRCEVAGRYQRDDGQAVVEVTTVDVDSVDGRHRFSVNADQLFD